MFISVPPPSTWFVFNDANSSAVDFCVVKLVDGGFHVAVCGEFDHTVNKNCKYKTQSGDEHLKC